MQNKTANQVLKLQAITLVLATILVTVLTSPQPTQPIPTQEPQDQPQEQPATKKQGWWIVNQAKKHQDQIFKLILGAL